MYVYNIRCTLLLNFGDIKNVARYFVICSNFNLGLKEILDLASACSLNGCHAATSQLSTVVYTIPKQKK